MNLKEEKKKKASTRCSQNLPSVEEAQLKDARTQFSTKSDLEEAKQTKKDAQADTSLKKAISLTEDITPIRPMLLAWSSYRNKIDVMDLEMKEDYANFDGVQLKYKANGKGQYGSWTHVKEIPKTKLLVSLHHSYMDSAKMEIFNISKKGQANKIYCFEEVCGVTGFGDVTYNVRRNVLGAISVRGKIAYHLFSIDAVASVAHDIVKLNRKSKWHSQHNIEDQYSISGLDFNPTGESAATIDCDGVCVISDVNTNKYSLHLNLRTIHYRGDDTWARCRWSTYPDESLLFVKYDRSELNIIDVEKKALTLKTSVQLETEWYTKWIDVCQSNGNLLASGGDDNNVKVFDRRESKIVKTFIGSKIVNRMKYADPGSHKCVRWSPNGDMLASASTNKAVKLLDFGTGKVILTTKTSDGGDAVSVCFI